MRLRFALGVLLALAALAISEKPPAIASVLFGVDSSKAPPQFSSPELDPSIVARGTDGIDFDINNYANQALWDRYLAKGDHMLCLMEATDQGAGWLEQDTRQPPSAASRWTGDFRAELQKWFWHESQWDKGWECDFEGMGLKTTFEGLGLNSQSKYDDEGDPQGGSNDCFSLQHYDEYWTADPNDEWGQMIPVKDQKYSIDGREYTATSAVYQFVINHQGAIIAKNIESPRHAVLSGMSWGRAATPGELPAIEFASDVFWGYWARDNPNVKNLRVYGAHHVINTDTSLLASRALRNIGKDRLVPWPGHVFEIGSEEYRALIGSPIGATAGHILAAHKAELGIKRITKVTVVTNEKSPFKNRRLHFDLHVFFSFEDVPPDDVTQPGGQAAAKREAGQVETRIASVENRGRNMVRVHTVMA